MTMYSIVKKIKKHGILDEECVVLNVGIKRSEISLPPGWMFLLPLCRVSLFLERILYQFPAKKYLRAMTLSMEYFHVT